MSWAESYLLIKRSDNGLWAVPAGGLELGDSVRQCAIREAYEETGLTPTKLAPIAILTHGRASW
jgi:8-oxo-dGTP pyrophosphatase MutT (NUDIX family)